MEQYLASMQMAAAALTTLFLCDTYIKACEVISEYDKLCADGRSEKSGEEIQKLLDRPDDHVHQLPLIGFNSGKYDMQIIKQMLAKVGQRKL